MRILGSLEQAKRATRVAPQNDRARHFGLKHHAPLQHERLAHSVATGGQQDAFHGIISQRVQEGDDRAHRLGLQVLAEMLKALVAAPAVLPAGGADNDLLVGAPAVLPAGRADSDLLRLQGGERGQHCPGAKEQHYFSRLPKKADDARVSQEWRR